MLAFVILMICAVPLCVYGAEPAEPNASNPEHNSQRILKSKVEAKPINNDPNKHKEGMAVIEGTSMTKTQQLQYAHLLEAQQLEYTQLLEIHRSYFTVFLQVLSIYLAVMGACLKCITDDIKKMKRNRDNGSKTVLISLILFSHISSCFFLVGSLYGREDAIKRNRQVIEIAKKLEVKHTFADATGKPKIEYINLELFGQVISAQIIVTISIVVGWVVMLIRVLMIWLKKLCITMIVLTELLITLWFFILTNAFVRYIKPELLFTIGIVCTIPIIISWMVMLIQGPKAWVKQQT